MRAVLVISDNPSLARMVRAVSPGRATVERLPRAKARQVLARRRKTSAPNLMVIDVDNGPPTPADVRALIGRRPPTIAVVSDPRARALLYRAGAVDCLVKPLIAREVSACIRRHLQPSFAAGSRSQGTAKIRPGVTERHLERQIVQNERLITIGRLVAGVCHSLTNRMQVIQGALALALEDADLPEADRSYLELCREEVHRAGTEVERLRSIYRPEIDPLGVVDISELLAETEDLVTEAARSRDVRIELSSSTDAVKVIGRAGQLQFALLGVLLNLIDLSDARTGARVWIQTRLVGPTVQLEFATDAVSAPASGRSRERRTRVLEHTLGLPTSRQVIQAHHGDAGLALIESGLNIWFSLPIA